MNPQNGYDIEDLSVGMSAEIAKTITDADIVLFARVHGRQCGAWCFSSMPATQPAQAPSRTAKWLDEIKALHRGENQLKTYDSANGVAARLMKTNQRLPQDKAQWLAQQWAEPRPQADGSTRWEILGDVAHRIINAQLFRVDEQLALYAAITAPTLMVEASDDSLAGWWGQRFTRTEFHERLKAVPDVRREVIADAGHMLHHGQPQALARLTEDFLTSP